MSTYGAHIPFTINEANKGDEIAYIECCWGNDINKYFYAIKGRNHYLYNYIDESIKNGYKNAVVNLQNTINQTSSKTVIKQTDDNKDNNNKSNKGNRDNNTMNLIDSDLYNNSKNKSFPCK
jgi:hypothetical protein